MLERQDYLATIVLRRMHSIGDSSAASGLALLGDALSYEGGAWG